MVISDYPIIDYEFSLALMAFLSLLNGVLSEDLVLNLMLTGQPEDI